MRRVVTGALELERAGKRIGSSLEAAPVVYVSDPDLFAVLTDVDLAEVSITSAATWSKARGPRMRFGCRTCAVSRSFRPGGRAQMCPLLENLDRGRQ